MNYQQQLAVVQGLSVQSDTQVRMDCPLCNGRNTFTNTNNMGRRLWNCYKASCTVSGNAKVNLSVDEIKQKHNNGDTTKDKFVFPEYIVAFKKEIIDFEGFRPNG